MYTCGTKDDSTLQILHTAHAIHCFATEGSSSLLLSLEFCTVLPPLTLLEQIPVELGGFRLQSEAVFLTGPFFSTSTEHIHCFPSLTCLGFEAQHLSSCLPIHLSACTTGFMTQMLQQRERLEHLHTVDRPLLSQTPQRTRN